LATLPDDFTVLNTALSGVSLAGSETPMYGALDGTYQFAGPYLASNPTHKVVVIFVADGLPSGGYCNTYYGGSDYEDIGTIAALAADALSYYGLPTYTVALDGSALVPCDAIAAAGGTSEAYDVTADTNLFLDVMEEIRWDNYGSRYIAPDPDQVDLSNINIVYTFGGIGDPETIPQADSLADCGVIIPNWYFDDPGNPTSILLCPNCRFTIEQDSNPLLQLAKGCPTVTNY
jgi:hypothetical protein